MWCIWKRIGQHKPGSRDELPEFLPFLALPEAVFVFVDQYEAERGHPFLVARPIRDVGPAIRWRTAHG